MIGVIEGKDQEARAILELAGINPDKYRIQSNNSTYVYAVNDKTHKFVIVEKETLEVVKVPVLWRAIRDSKIITQIHYKANTGGNQVIKCEINTENIVTTEIRGKVEDLLDEFSIISKEIVKVMLQNGLSAGETMVILAAYVSQGIEKAEEESKER